MAFTYFFRDMQTLETIQDHALPTLKTRKYIRIWDAGCAMGLEPYSLAIMLRESMGHMYFRNVKISATDIDISNQFEQIIQKGVYPKEQIERIPKTILEKYFKLHDNHNNYIISEEIRKAVSFQRHDLLTLKPTGQEYGLVLCKNVLLHFNEEQRIKVIKMFHGAIMNGGFFACEQTQKLPKAVGHLFEPIVSNVQLFRKISKADN